MNHDVPPPHERRIIPTKPRPQTLFKIAQNRKFERLTTLINDTFRLVGEHLALKPMNRMRAISQRITCNRWQLFELLSPCYHHYILQTTKLAEVNIELKLVI